MSNQEPSLHRYAPTVADVCKCGEPPCSSVHIQTGPFLVRLGPGGPHVPEPASRRPWRKMWIGQEELWAGSEPVDPNGDWWIIDADDESVCCLGGDEESEANADAIIRAMNLARNSDEVDEADAAPIVVDSPSGGGPWMVGDVR